jgi:formate/nitrite transporter
MTVPDTPVRVQHDAAPVLGVDALVPREMADRAETVGATKASMPVRTTAVLGVLAGAFIALGAIVSIVATTTVTGGPVLPFGVARLLAGAVFSLGLILVVVGGAELFTGNTLIVMAFAARRVSLRALLRNWTIVFAANFAGAMSTAFFVFWSGTYRAGQGAVGRRTLEIAQSKSALPMRDAFLLGVFANVLVCLAVWLCLAARTVTDKVLAIVPPITAFVAAGFEHSIANMYFLPAGLFVKAWAPASFWSSAGVAEGSYPDVTWGRLVANLVPVTLGNIVGGAVLVGLVYWFVYGHRRPSEG